MAVTVYDAIIGGTTIRQVRSSQFSANAEVQRGRYSGGYLSQATYGRKSEPKATISTMDLYNALNGIDPTTGLAVSAGTIALPWNERTNGGTLAGSGSATKISGANGLAVLTSISANQDDDGAVAGIDVFFRSTDGFTAPHAIAGGQALASQSFQGEYDLGPVTVNGEEITQVTGVNVNFGVTVLQERHKGGNYPDRQYITTVDPTMEITFRDWANLVEYTPLFTAMSAAVVYFRKKADGGVHAGSNTDISLSFGGGIIQVESANGEGANSGSAVLRLHGKGLTKSLAATSP